MGKKRVITKSGGSTGSSSVVKEARISHKVARGIAHISATYNNTSVAMSDERGNILAWSSAGSLGFSGTKKATPFAAARVADTVVEKIRKVGLQEIAVLVSGVGSGRDAAIRALANRGLTITSVRDITPLPHNGPRPKKVRRV